MSEIDQPALDAVRALQRPGAPDLLQRIIGVFVDQTRSSVNSLLEASASGDLKAVGAAAHAMKSSAAYLGATQFSARMANIERAAREDNLPACQEFLVGLEDQTQAVIDELLSLQDKAA